MATNLGLLAAQGYETGLDLAGKTAAMRAAKEQYGPLAGDSGLFSVLTQIDSMRRNQDRADQTTAFDQGMQTRQEARTQGAYDFEMQGAQQDRRKQAVLGMVNGLRAARDRGEDVGAAFDRLAGTLPALGVDVADVPAMRQALIDNPAVLDDYYASLTGGAPAARGATAAAGAPAKAAPAGDSDAIAVLDDAIGRVDLLLPERDEQGYLTDKGMERYQTGRSVVGGPDFAKLFRHGGLGGLGPTVPGTPAAEYRRDIVGLQADALKSAFATLKGGGQITEKESQFAADAIANLDRTVSFEAFEKELRRARNYFVLLRQNAERRASGENVPDAELPSLDVEPGKYERAPDWAKKAAAYGLKVGDVLEGIGTYKGGDPDLESSYEPLVAP